MSELVLDRPQIWTPDYGKLGKRLAVPKWARPWEKPVEYEDELVAAVANDSSAGALDYNTSPAPGAQSIAFTNTAGGLVTFVLGLAAGSGFAVSLATLSYGGSAMTKFTERAVTSGGTDSRIQIWYLLSAPTGANNFTFTPTFSAGSVSYGVWHMAASWTGHDTTTPLTSNFGVNSSNGVAASSATVTTPSAVASGNMFVGTLGQGDGTWSTFTPTQWATAASGTTQLSSGRAGFLAGTGSTMSVTGSWGSADSWVGIAFEIAALAGATVKRPKQTMVRQAIGRMSRG